MKINFRIQNDGKRIFERKYRKKCVGTVILIPVVNVRLYLRTTKAIHAHVDTVDHNNKSSNSLNTFSFFDELNE